jgi:hypothetical protein
MRSSAYNLETGPIVEETPHVSRRIILCAGRQRRSWKLVLNKKLQEPIP